MRAFDGPKGREVEAKWAEAATEMSPEVCPIAVVTTATIDSKSTESSFKLFMRAAPFCAKTQSGVFHYLPSMNRSSVLYLRESRKKYLLCYLTSGRMCRVSEEINRDCLSEMFGEKVRYVCEDGSLRRAISRETLRSEIVPGVL